PFFPYSSDDGFSIVDYRRVNPQWGSWNDIHALGERCVLMVDAVINHTSVQSIWFQKFLKCEKHYMDYFIYFEKKINLSYVFRPRTTPLLSKFTTDCGEKWVWTTFSRDQVDLNYKNPDLLIEIIELLLFYIGNGADYIRLDAIAYIWKELGTPSIHLPQAHKIIKIFRHILAVSAPWVKMVSETNVPHEYNTTYFGDYDSLLGDYDEAQVIYNFSLPPLIMHAIVTGNSSVLNHFVSEKMETPSENTYFFNFIASHDGIGVLPASEFLSPKQVQNLAEITISNGGKVSYKTNDDGTRSIYELNTTLFDFFKNAREKNKEAAEKRFLVSQAVLLSIKGIAGVYIHSLFGSDNCYQCLKKTNHARSLNRKKFSWQEFQDLIEGVGHDRQYRIFNNMKKIMRLRLKYSCLGQNGKQKVITAQEEIFIVRRSDDCSTIYCMANLSDAEKELEMDFGASNMLDIISDKEYNSENGIYKILFDPYQYIWMKIQIG
ncbi:MAG TPA: sugar phosphorylase, partial [Bacteroidetes bacterium]|nr:sugar phosphorylase [Bacteroidota bacterium]